MEKQKESLLNGYPNVISYECTKKIIEQMERNICKINIGEQQGTGFFTKIPFPNQNNMLPVLITNNHIINNDTLNKKNIKIKIDIKEDEDVKEIILNKRMKYTNEEYDTTIIEIKKEDNINNYLELDDIIINDISNNINKNKEYINKTIYIIQYPENNLSVSYGILDNIYEDKKYDFNHKCSTKFGSSGSPILNISNKIIGIHKEGYNNKYNIGTFLNYPIREFIQLNINNNEVLLKAFNSKYKLDIKNNKTYKLDLSCKNFGNEILNELKTDFLKDYQDIIEKNENELTINDFDNSDKKVIRLKSQNDLALNKRLIDELGFSNLKGNGFTPSYNYYKENDKIIIKIESPGISTVESYISYSDAYPFPIIKIKGSKNKDKKPEKIEDNIFNSREYGQYSLDIPFKEDDYSLTNEEPEIEGKHGIFIIKYKLEKKLGKNILNVDLDEDI